MFDALASHPWAYPLLEVTHLLGVSLVIGNLALIELRVWGLGASLDASTLARLSLSLVIAGFGIAAATGLLMFATQPQELLANRAFTVKMLLLGCAACNAAWFHTRQSLQRLDRTARALATVSLLLWLLILACGRWIAYR